MSEVWFKKMFELHLTFISQHSNSDGQEGTQHIEQSYGGLQCPFILTLSALGAFLDSCGEGANITK